ncbi:hypothetical protein ACFPVT_01790 [Corynebacterium choanae]|uniref:Transmembrane protein n=1 Tax=Corynebacterium choanae TaxID=1862358 RepID=A0A3G6J9A0_9CORY|nr:hypothetical protein [Corynebacterium choanae]AZA12604.1 hypothetical protein CCHOA_00875 [Corynebacterium choanae]
MSKPDVRPNLLASHRWWILTAAGCGLVVALVLYPFAAPGALLWRDMSIPPRMLLTADVFGWYGSWPRAVPQDAVLAMLSPIIPADVLARLWLAAALVAGLVGASWFAWRTTATRPLPVQVAAVGTVMLLCGCNGWVVERLLQGHWSLVAAAWLLIGASAALLAQHRVVALLLVWLATATPTGWLCVLLWMGCVLLSCGGFSTPGRLRDGVGAALLLLTAALPWAVPLLLRPAAVKSSDPLGELAAFAPRAEHSLSVVVSLAGLGGIWNAASVPPSRTVLVVCAAAVVTVLAFRQWSHIARPLRLLALAGVLLTVLPLVAPDVTGWLLLHVPAAGIVRDSQKFLLLVLPALLAGVAAWFHSSTAGARLVQLLLVVLCLFPVPGMVHDIAVLRPTTHYDAALVAAFDTARSQSGCRQVIDDNTDLVRTVSGRQFVNPVIKAVGAIPAETLIVDGRIVSGGNPQQHALRQAAATGDHEQLVRAGVGSVWSPDGQQHTVVQPVCQPQRTTLVTIRVLTWSWLLLPGWILFLQWRRRYRRRHPVARL